MRLPEGVLMLSRFLKSTIGFSLIVVFFGIGSCTAKRVLHAFLEEFPRTEQNQDIIKSTRISVFAHCGTNNKLTQKLSLQERGSIISHPLNVFLPRFDFPGIENEYNLRYNLDILSSYPVAIPVYLRNRNLLI